MSVDFKLEPESAEIMRAAVARIINQATFESSLKFDMVDWARWENGETVYSIRDLATIKGANCGGSCCFYGEIAIMNYDSLNPDEYIEVGVSTLLGIPDEYGQSLYMSDDWPLEFNLDYQEAKDSKDRLGMALALQGVVEDFIEVHS